MIISLPSLTVAVFFTSLCYNMVSFGGQKKPGPRPDWSPLGVSSKISDEHPSPFYMGVPPPPPPPGDVDSLVVNVGNLCKMTYKG